MRLIYHYLDFAQGLEEADRDELLEVFRVHGGSLPDPLKSKVYVVRDLDKDDREGKIVGFYCLQVKLHAEPMWLDEEYRGRLCSENGYPIWFNLVMGIEPFTREDDCYIVAENGLTDEMCRAMGLEKVEFNVYVKRKP